MTEIRLPCSTKCQMPNCRNEAVVESKIKQGNTFAYLCNSCWQRSGIGQAALIVIDPTAPFAPF